VRALGGGAWGGVSPLYGERVWGGGCALSSKLFRIFGVKMTCFGVFLALFLVTEYAPMGARAPSHVSPVPPPMATPVH